MTTSADKLITRRLPGYDALVGEWDFFKGSYLGGRDYNEANLFRYFKEGDDEFKARVGRAYRENHSKRVVDLINSYLFKQEAKRETENARLKAFFENIDGRGKKALAFWKAVSQWVSVAGRMYVVCDKKPLPEDQRTGTHKDNLNPKAQPYLYWVFPQDVLDISFDEETGKIRWILIKERVRDDEDPFTATGEIEDRYRLWTVEGWFLFDKAGEMVDSGPGPGVVPVVIVDNEEKDDYTGQSLIQDIAYLDRAIFNNWSRIDVIINDQTFSQLVYPAEGLPVEIFENEKLRRQFLTVATNRIMLVSNQAQVQPNWISPDASQAEFILNTIGKQTLQLYASLGLQGETGTEVKQQSGVAKAWDFDKLNKLLAGKGDNLEQAEKHIVEIWGAWTGDSGASAEVVYPDDFDVKTLADEIAMAQELATMNISPTFNKMLDKAIAQKVFPKADPKDMEKVNKEIEEKEEFDAANQGEAFDFDKANPQQPGKKAPAEKDEAA